MNIIIVSRRHGQTKTFANWFPFLIISFCAVVFSGAGYLGYQWGKSSDNTVFDLDSADVWSRELNNQQVELENVRNFTEEQIQALTVRVGELQARLTRLDAMGERLVSVANLGDGEFDFSVAPALGGPGTENLDEANYLPPDFMSVLDELSARIEDREQQLSVLESFLGDRKVLMDTFIAGRPIKRGWMSSRYGYRTDPFNGKRAWHDGVDFAGRDGSDIIAVAAGVVTFAGKKSGYGNMIDINHGNGYTTRYAHAKELVVKVGDVIKKGQTVALMGSTGRSTGPHVHFEVMNLNKRQDPTQFINRAALNN